MTEGPPQIARVEPGDVTPTLVTALYTGALVSRVEAGVVALTGPGAVTSFQGLLTNDVELPGDGSFVYGALLTPKGMIVVDGWAARLGATVSYTVPSHGGGRERALAIFTRSVPPRLARVSDCTSEVAVYRLAGPGALAVAVAAGLRGPPAGRPGRPRPRGGGSARAVSSARRGTRPGRGLLFRPRAAGRPRRWLERGHVRRSRRWPGDEPGVRAGDRGRRRGALDRSGADPAGGGARLRGTRRRP